MQSFLLIEFQSEHYAKLISGVIAYRGQSSDGRSDKPEEPSLPEDRTAPLIRWRRGSADGYTKLATFALTRSAQNVFLSEHGHQHLPIRGAVSIIYDEDAAILRLNTIGIRDYLSLIQKQTATPRPSVVLRDISR